MLKRTIVLPDIHVPCHDKASLSAVIQFIKYFRPDTFVQLGDFCNFDSLSDYPINKPSDFIYLEDEIGASNDVLDQIEKALPRNCEKYLVGGNHEDRFVKYKAKHILFGEQVTRSLKDFKEWWDEYNLPTRRNWNWCHYGEWFEIGKIIYTHGWFTGNNAAQRMLQALSFKNLFFGHTHQHLVATATDAHGLPSEAESIGTLSRFDLSYLRGKPPVNWTHGFSWIYTRDDGTFTKYFTHIIEGRFISAGKEFDGRLP